MISVSSIASISIWSGIDLSTISLAVEIMVRALFCDSPQARNESVEQMAIVSGRIVPEHPIFVTSLWKIVVAALPLNCWLTIDLANA